MAFDGFVISHLVSELSQKLTGGRITKIAQPEEDELILTVHKYRLFLSAGASLPLAYITSQNKPSPLTAPNFCMLLRKHLNSARIISITQPGLERIIDMKIEHLNELGDVCIKHLMVELMGKHSNIIFTDEELMIIDSIKHISCMVSSVREVLPGRKYFIPKTEEKYSLFHLELEQFQTILTSVPQPTFKILYLKLTGISPQLAQELCYRANVESERPGSSLSPSETESLFHQLMLLKDMITEKNYTPSVIFRSNAVQGNDIPVEFSSMTLSDLLCDPDCYERTFDSISELLEYYFAAKNAVTRIRQKSTDLRKIVTTALDRNRKKYSLQADQLKDTQKREKYRIYGELLNTYGYMAAPKDTSITCNNYYTGEDITIPLDPALSATDNAKKYFNRYNKLKRTFEAVSGQIEETKEEIEHLESILTALDIARNKEDLVELKEELTEYGYIRRRLQKNQKGRMSKKNYKPEKKEKVTSKPFHYISSDGFDIYVGKNNYQNDFLTFKLAQGNDWWFHAKKIPGSHVLVRSNGEMPPDRTFEEAASLAAHYSQGKDNEKVEIDYTEKKNVKKPNGGKPGFVIYHTNYSMVASPDIEGIQQL